MHELENVQIARQNCNDAEQRERNNRTSKIQTRRTRDKQRQNKETMQEPYDDYTNSMT